jgi:3-deoxy-manno-octulosonate cytidylyltransferase (CMP-KDO synthetase)
VACNGRPVIAMIPARLASTRFPRKVLANQTGKTLIEHVFGAASRAACVDRIVVATDSEEVVRAVEEFAGQGVLTSNDHPNGASRLGQVCDLLDIADDAVIVNVQGDEPELDPAVIDAAAHALVESDSPMATIASPFAEDEDAADPNIVKVVVDQQGRAMYFSRSVIPFDREDDGKTSLLKHVGLYAYDRPFLRVYSTLAPTPMEQCERLEQLRVLEHGYSIAVATVTCKHHGIDTPEQYAEFVQRWRDRHDDA